MREIVRIISRALLGIFVAGSLVVIASIIYLESKLPSVETLKDIQLQVPLKIYSADYKLIAEYGEKRRTPVTIDRVPQTLIQAVLATEDRRFYDHPGVDLRGLIRASVSLLSTGTKEQGGSTITMQVARNFFLSRKKTYLRKINEILLAFKIENELTKDEILNLYLNKIYLGKHAYGVAAAAEVYYGVPVEELTLPQMAMIAGLPKAPSSINPINSPTAAFKRRKHVLDRMLTYGFITPDVHKKAVNSPETAKYHGRPVELHAPYVAEMVRQELYEQYGDDIYSAGYEVITTIDSELQRHANHAVLTATLEYDRRHGFRQAIHHFDFNDDISLNEEIDTWIHYLQSLHHFGERLFPVVITSIEDDHAWGMNEIGELFKIPWAGVQWARPVLSNKRLGKKPTAIQEVLSMGDVVYIENHKGYIQLAQIPEVEGALVSMEANSGAILALVGGVNYHTSHFNRATQAARQPGSAFKPFIYAAALNKQFTPASIINDAPIVQEDPVGENDWRPQNHTKKFYGPTRLREGIIKSRNLVSIRLLKSIGIDNAMDFLDNFGFQTERLPKGLSLALGTGQITPLELTTAYCTFPNGGYRVSPNIITKIQDYQDTIIHESTPAVACASCDWLPETQPDSPFDIPDLGEQSYIRRAPRVISPQLAYTMTSLLQDAVQQGTGRRLKHLNRTDLAGKTGTTNDKVDAWYAGFNADIVTTAWVGFDEHKSIKEYAASAALPMWMYYMENALKGKPNHSPIQPPGMVTVRIDPETGLLARAGQTDSIYEIFIEGQAPTKYAPLSKKVEVDGENMAPSPSIETLF